MSLQPLSPVHVRDKPEKTCYQCRESGKSCQNNAGPDSLGLSTMPMVSCSSLLFIKCDTACSMSPLIHSSYRRLGTQQLLHVPCSGYRSRNNAQEQTIEKRRLYSLFRLFLGQQENTCTRLWSFITSFYKLTKTALQSCAQRYHSYWSTLFHRGVTSGSIYTEFSIVYTDTKYFAPQMKNSATDHQPGYPARKPGCVKYNRAHAPGATETALQ